MEASATFKKQKMHVAVIFRVKVYMTIIVTMVIITAFIYVALDTTTNPPHITTVVYMINQVLY